MPYEWVKRPNGAPERSGAPLHEEPLAELHLWPYRSLPRRGFVLFIAATSAMLALPLIAVLGTMVFWGLLPFLLAAVWGVWRALSHSYRQGELTEVLRLWPDRIEIARRAPDGQEQRWQANPYWVRVTLHSAGGPVPDYLTLKGDGRAVELGAFLAPEERRALKDEIDTCLAGLRADA